MNSRDWQVQEAKAEFSALIRAAEMAPQTITRNGKIAAVVISVTEFERLTTVERARESSLLDFFQSWPDFEIPRRDVSDVGREVRI